MDPGPTTTSEQSQFIAKYHEARARINETIAFTQRDVLILCDIYSVWTPKFFCNVENEAKVCSDPRVCSQLAIALKDTMLNAFRGNIDLSRHTGSMICACLHHHNHISQSSTLLPDNTLDGYVHTHQCKWNCCGYSWSKSHPPDTNYSKIVSAFANFLRAHVVHRSIVDPLLNAIVDLTSAYPDRHEQFMRVGFPALVVAVLDAHEECATFVGDAAQVFCYLSAPSSSAAAACENAGASLALVRVLAREDPAHRDTVIKALVSITCPPRIQKG